MTRPPIDPRQILIANIAARASQMPGATLFEIYPQAVVVATCAGPDRLYVPGAGCERLTAWQALRAARSARSAARRPALHAWAPKGAA
jgi:hypothetical protein